MTLDLASIKRRAQTTHNKSEVDKARDAEMLEVIAALERAVGLLRDRQWGTECLCICCTGPTEHRPGCALQAFLSAFPPPGSEGA